MSGLLFKLELFVMSFLPLFVILAIQNHARTVVLLVMAGLIVVAVAATVHLLGAPRRLGGVDAKITESLDEGQNAAGYLSGYILPVMAPTLPDRWENAVGVGLYLVVLLSVTINSNLLLVNPTFYLLGRRVARVKIEESLGQVKTNRALILICRDLPTEGNTIHVVKFGRGLMEKRKR